MGTKIHLVTGYTTRRHLLLDLDDTTFSKASKVVKLIMKEWPEVGSCLIMRSSERSLTTSVKYSWNSWPYTDTEADNYHLIFNNCIGWNKCCRIAETLAGLKILQKDYEKIRTFRGDMTLRVSEVVTLGGVKPPPVAVASIKGLNGKIYYDGISSYMEFYRAANQTKQSSSYHIASQLSPSTR